MTTVTVSAAFMCLIKPQRKRYFSSSYAVQRCRLSEMSYPITAYQNQFSDADVDLHLG